MTMLETSGRDRRATASGKARGRERGLSHDGSKARYVLGFELAVAETGWPLADVDEEARGQPGVTDT
jgi:hypothetical protein